MVSNIALQYFFIWSVVRQELGIREQAGKKVKKEYSRPVSFSGCQNEVEIKEGNPSSILLLFFPSSVYSIILPTLKLDNQCKKKRKSV